MDISDDIVTTSVTNYQLPTITGNVAYNYGSGTITITGIYFAKDKTLDDVDVTKITLLGENGAPQVNIFFLSISSNVEITSETSIVFTLDAAERFAFNSILNQDGTLSD